MTQGTHRGLVHIHACVGGVVHMTVGAVTIRLDPETFQLVAEEIGAKARELRPMPPTSLFEIIKGGLS
jgi:hypothetical protein